MGICLENLLTETGENIQLSPLGSAPAQASIHNQSIRRSLSAGQSRINSPSHTNSKPILQTCKLRESKYQTKVPAWQNHHYSTLTQSPEHLTIRKTRQSHFYPDPRPPGPQCLRTQPEFCFGCIFPIFSQHGTRGCLSLGLSCSWLLSSREHCGMLRFMLWYDRWLRWSCPRGWDRWWTGRIG